MDEVSLNAIKIIWRIRNPFCTYYLPLRNALRHRSVTRHFRAKRYLTRYSKRHVTRYFCVETLRNALLLSKTLRNALLKTLRNALLSNAKSNVYVVVSRLPP